MKKIDLLCCRDCKQKLKVKKNALYCSKCKISFPYKKGVFDFNKNKDLFVDLYQKFQYINDPYALKSAPKIVIAGHNRKSQILAHVFKKYNIQNKIVLDVGSGEDIPFFLKECKLGIIQDISKKALQRSKHKTKDHKFIFVASNQDLPFFSNSVDIVFAGEIIEHVEFPKKFVEEIYRLLKPGGRLILTTPNFKALFYHLLGFKYSKCPQHISLQSYFSLIHLLNKRFKIHKVYGFNQSFFHYLDWFITNKSLVKWWSKLFFEKPHLSTGIILDCEKNLIKCQK